MAYAIIIILMFMYVFGMISTIATVGKKRNPITPGIAAIATIIHMACLAGLVYILITI